MQHNECNGYNSHINFILAQLCLGPFRRVADALYLHRTREDENSVRVGFRSWSSQQQYEATTVIIAQCVQTVAAAEIERSLDSVGPWSNSFSSIILPSKPRKTS